MPPAILAVAPTPAGAPGLKLIQIGEMCYLHYVDAAGNHSADFAMSFQDRGDGLIRGIRSGNPDPAFARDEDGMIQIWSPPV